MGCGALAPALTLVEITFIEAHGTKHVVDANPGYSVMEAAIWNEVPGIEAVCGGACVCSTCHCYIDADWQAKLQQQSPEELDLLDGHPEEKEDSRLSCQIKVTKALDGLTVALPVSQRDGPG